MKRLLGVNERLPLSQWYEALDSLYSCQMDIQKQLFMGDTKRIYLYDIISSYPSTMLRASFEAIHCPIADWRHNREARREKRSY